MNTPPLRLSVRRLPSRLLPALALALLAFVAGPAATAHAELRDHMMWWAPQAVTVGGHEIDVLLMFIFWLTLAVFIATQSVYIYFIIKYRYRKGVKAVYSHGNNKLELIWTATPAAIFITLALWSDREWLQLRSKAPPESLSIDLVAYQFGFHIRNPGKDGKLAKYDQLWIEKGTNDFGVDPTVHDPAGDDDYVSENQITLPVNRPVNVILRSEDVIHAFYIPEFRMYQDILPGRKIDWVWFTPEKIGHYALACNQLCGSGHYNMQAKVDVVSEDDYARLVKEKSDNAIEARKPKDQPPAPPVATAPAPSPAPVVAALNR